MTKNRNSRMHRFEQSSDEGEPSTDTELLVSIADGLVECYRDLLGEPLPDRMKCLVRKLAAGDPVNVMKTPRVSGCH